MTRHTTYILAALCLIPLGCSRDAEPFEVVVGPGVTASPANIVLRVGVAETVSITATDRGGNVVRSPVVTFSSGDTTVASVDVRGRVVGVAPGRTAVTFRTMGQFGEVPVTVTP